MSYSRIVRWFPPIRQAECNIGKQKHCLSGVMWICDSVSLVLYCRFIENIDVTFSNVCKNCNLWDWEIQSMVFVGSIMRFDYIILFWLPPYKFLLYTCHILPAWYPQQFNFIPISDINAAPSLYNPLCFNYTFTISLD